MVQKLSVLVIEDEKSICDFIAKTLNASDYKAVTAGSGKEGLAILTSALPDLVLLDLGLPDMDGIDIIKQTREWSSLPIIVISARVQEREKVAALDAGADDYITKPFGTDELLPWQTIDVGVTTKFLLHEREKALRSEATPDCRTHCNGCGARMLSERRLCDESPAV